MSKKIKIIAGFLVAVVVAYGVIKYINHGIESTDDAAVEAHVIPISTKVPGYIVSLNIKDNQLVKKGDVLVQIDPRDYALRVESAKANLTLASVALDNAVIQAKRQIAIGKAAGTQKEIDNALTAQSSAQASVDNAKAMLALAEKDLNDTKIIAPEDGLVTMRTAEQGAYAAVGQQLFTLVGTERWIVANFKEVQITDMRPGQKVDIVVDAYPNLKLTGVVDSIQSGTGARFSAFPPENATGNFVKIVQRVPVKILLEGNVPAEIVLGPGLSVVPTVHTL